MYRFVEINPEKNMLLCSSGLVGTYEWVEVHAPCTDTPCQVLSNVLQKTRDPDYFTIRSSFTGDLVGKEFKLGETCILRVLKRTLSGVRRRKFSKDEKSIVDLEKGNEWKERKVNRAKTGSVRNKRSKNTK
jgi:hypothetical protein